MSNVVLSDDLLKLYYSFARNGQVTNDQSGNNVTKITKLLSCIKEFYTNKEQLKRCGITEEIMPAVESMPLFTLDNTTTELKNLILKSKLKLLLTDKNSTEQDIISYNILSPNPKYGFHYSMTFKTGEDKLFAINHIKLLLENVSKVEIIDPYFIADEYQFAANLSLLNQLITNKANKIEIACQESNQLKTKLTSDGYTNTNCPPLPTNTHDRYIKANGVKIHLSSGFYALTQQNKELTYMVEIL